MNKKTAINKVIFGVLLAFAMPFMVFGATPTVDNPEPVTIEQLQAEIINLLLAQLHMLQQQLEDLTNAQSTAPEFGGLIEEIAPIVEQPVKTHKSPLQIGSGTAQA